MESTRVNRLLKTLGAMGLAEQDEKRRYRVGAGIHALSILSLRASGMARVALPRLLMLRDLGQRMALGSLWRHQVVYLYHGEGRGSDIEGLGGGQVWPAVESSIGHVLLAGKRAEELESILAGQEVDWERLNARLEAVRESGYGEVEFSEPAGQRSVAVAVNGAIAIAVTGVFGAEAVAGYVERLRATAEQIRDQMEREQR